MYNQFHVQITETKFHVQSISWKLIPLTPYMEGLQKAAVQSLNTYLGKTASDSNSTFEGFATLLVNIKSCLNYCPIFAISEEFYDNSVLIPNHFLIGYPLLAQGEPKISNSHVSWHKFRASVPENRKKQKKTSVSNICKLRLCSAAYSLLQYKSSNFMKYFVLNSNNDFFYF